MVECSHMSSEQTFFEWMGTEFVTKKKPYYEHRRHHIQPILFWSALKFFFPSHLCPIEGYSVGSSLVKWRWEIHLLFHACRIFYTVMDISFFHQYCWAALDSFRSDRNVQMNGVRLACFYLVSVWFGLVICSAFVVRASLVHFLWIVRKTCFTQCCRENSSTMVLYTRYAPMKSVIVRIWSKSTCYSVKYFCAPSHIDKNEAYLGRGQWFDFTKFLMQTISVLVTAVSNDLPKISKNTCLGFPIESSKPNMIFGLINVARSNNNNGL